MATFALQPTCSCCGDTKGSSDRRNLQSEHSKAVVSTLKCIRTEKFVSEDDIQLLLRGYVCRQCFSALQRYQKLQDEFGHLTLHYGHKRSNYNHKKIALLSL